MKDFHGRWKKMPDVVVNVRAPTAGKARAMIAAKAQDAGYNAIVPEIQVRVGQWITGFSVWL